MEKRKNKQKNSTQQSNDFPIVGIGASAGGLEAFAGFFSKMPVDSGIAYILIQHIDPSHVGNIVELLKRYTRMPVIEAKDGQQVEPDHVYMIPQNVGMSIVNRRLTLAEQPEQRGAAHSIDLFFRALAQDLKDKAIAVLLSGTGTDGSIGARAVKAEAGVVMVQDPATAKYDGMPRSAISAGVADFILPPEKMAENLIEYVHTSYGKPAEKRRQALASAAESLQKIFTIVRNRTRRDFSGYKLSTINRRIERRMSVNKTDKLEDYIRLLQESPQEVNALAKDFLIQVTSFFRDPETFEALKEKLKLLIQKKTDAEAIRIWAAGCSTGEEAYSLAIIIHECFEGEMRGMNAQVFATDIDADGINTARLGVYPESIKADVSAERLKRFFVHRDGQYQVAQEIRERVVFAVHDMLSDPPFSRMDLVSARNVLIYLNAETQRRVIPVLHYALNNGGILFLGTAETIGEFTSLFNTLDRKNKIYEARKKAERMPPAVFKTPVWRHADLLTKERLPAAESGAEVEAPQPAEKLLLKALPPTVLTDENLRILYVYGATGRYLELKEGEPSNSLTDMARPDIRAPLANAISEALAQNKEVVREAVRYKTNGDRKEVRIRVKPIKTGQTTHLLVLFEDMQEAVRKRGKKTGESGTRAEDLERELQDTRESLRSTVEELETANEELRSTNEEYQSANEELQSTNEELETSREELQSINEELMTVNTEHQKKIEELSISNDDMKNLLNSTKIATIFVDEEMRIKRYTPAATGILNLIDTDNGRPIGHITSSLINDDIPGKVQKVLDTLIPVAEEVQAKSGRRYSMRINPYRTMENAIAGAVITFIDITELKDLQEKQKESLEYVNIIETLREPLIVLDSGLRVILANSAFYRTFKVMPGQTEGKLLYELGDGQWNIPALRKLLEEILPKNTVFEDYAVEHDFPGTGHRKIILNARRLKSKEGGTEKILLAMQDVTEKKEHRKQKEE